MSLTMGEKKISFLIFLLCSCLLHAQEGESPSVSFPLGPVLAEALYGDGRWRPDWPVEIAPDAFITKGEAAVTVELVAVREIGGGEAAGENGGAPPGKEGGEAPPVRGSRYTGVPYRLVRDGGGRLAAFPMALPLDFTGEGPPGLVFAQVEAGYGGEGGIGELRILAPAAEEEPAGGEPAGEAGPDGEKPGTLLWSVFFPVPFLPGTFPAGEPVEVQRGEELHYVMFGGSGDWITETWYDPLGNFTAYFETRIRPEGLPAGGRPRVLSLEGGDYRGNYSYESGGNLSEYSGDQGLFSAVYGVRGRPLYWTAGRDYALQWDEEGRLTGMRDLAPPGGEGPAAFRYEYELDSRGNWVRRRETALFLRENLLLPGSMRETIRRIDYYTEGD
ncbi:MAG: hypothetical protein LBB77_05620 [Treponema sp.]|jgi:hypothetical protein|nr:hypothetical protein [Treponema sp.]